MSAEPMDAPAMPSATGKLHPKAIRAMHWINAVAMIVMIGSGWGIYNDSVIVSGLSFPGAITLGNWAPQHLQWHFAAMWVLMANGLLYLIYGFATGRFRERMLPIRVADIVQTIRDTLRFKLAHEDLTVYNAVQKILYLVVILAGIVQVLTGLAIWKPVQLGFVIDLFGGFQGARIAHFIGMGIIVGFMVVHVALALLVPSTLWAMLSGGPRVQRRAARR